MTRFVAINLADDDDAALRGTIAVGIAVSVGLAAILGVVLFLAAPWLANSVYGDPELVNGLRWVAVGLPSASFTIVVLSADDGLAHDAAQRHRRLDGRAPHAGRPDGRGAGAGRRDHRLADHAAGGQRHRVGDGVDLVAPAHAGPPEGHSRPPDRRAGALRGRHVGVVRGAGGHPVGGRAGPRRAHHRRRRGRVPGGHPDRAVLRAGRSTRSPARSRLAPRTSCVGRSSRSCDGSTSRRPPSS